MLQLKNVNYIISGDYTEVMPKFEGKTHGFKIKKIGTHEDLELTNGETEILILSMASQNGALYITMVNKPIDSPITVKQIEASWNDSELKVREQINKVLATWTKYYI